MKGTSRNTRPEGNKAHINLYVWAPHFSWIEVYADCRRGQVGSASNPRGKTCAVRWGGFLVARLTGIIVKVWERHVPREEHEQADRSAGPLGTRLLSS